MELPNISIPKALLEAIPMDQIPTLAHPPLIHFAIILPIIIVLLELVNIIVKGSETPEEPKGRGVSTLSFLLIVAMVVIFALTYLSGSVDGKAAWDTLSEAGQSALKEHKLLGTYLVFGSIALLVFKFIALISGAKGRILLFILAIVFMGVTLKQGKEGGVLVYEHGANVEAFKDCDDDKFDLNEEIDSLKEEIAKKVNPAPVEEVAKEVATPKATPVEEEKKSVVQDVVSQAEKAIATVKDIVTNEESKAVESSVGIAATKAEMQVTKAEDAIVTTVDVAKVVETPLHDVVTNEESKAVESSVLVAGEEATKVEIQQTEAKDVVVAKEAPADFADESNADVAKVVK